MMSTGFPNKLAVPDLAIVAIVNRRCEAHRAIDARLVIPIPLDRVAEAMIHQIEETQVVIDDSIGLGNQFISPGSFVFSERF